jgi:AmmeMemoRadiSam system protein A
VGATASEELPALEHRDGQELLRIARATLREYLATGLFPPGAPHRRILLEQRGAFVSLYAAGRLRGCIGRIEPDTPLYLAVEQLTASATRDPRFEPLRLEELPDTAVEISVLSAPEAASFERIELGRHGLLLTQGYHRGVLLPKVAVQYGWSVQRFLDETCLKAGLVPGAWRDPATRLQIFTVQSFCEATPP